MTSVPKKRVCDSCRKRKVRVHSTHAAGPVINNAARSNVTAASRNATTASTTTCSAPLNSSESGWSSRKPASASHRALRRFLLHAPRHVKDANGCRRREAKHRKAVERLDGFVRTLADETTRDPSQPGASPEPPAPLPTDQHPPSPPGPFVSALTREGHQPDSSGKFHFAGYEIGFICPRNGLPMFSSNGRRWIEARTGQAPAFPTFDAYDKHHLLYGDAASTMLVPRAQLPAREAAEERLASYCNNHIWLVFPMVDPVLFKRTIAAAYQPEGQLDASYQAEARLCVLSFLCVSSIFLPSHGLAPAILAASILQLQSWAPQMFAASSVHLLQICLMQVRARWAQLETHPMRMA